MLNSDEAGLFVSWFNSTKGLTLNIWLTGARAGPELSNNTYSGNMLFGPGGPRDPAVQLDPVEIYKVRCLSTNYRSYQTAFKFFQTLMLISEKKIKLVCFGKNVLFRFLEFEAFLFLNLKFLVHRTSKL